ncbi:hypothetical protein PR202_gb20798 [Eleusine coracana subsp. coracana]|uniref:Uncharacterized protein n=1 Tax=Eleusine coracana subsp. coracana TaxID=191504 RepID=A0AAV5FBE6_ELECO|nr:hypothetical protein PR202_gb20798 [Eleusine coracana subsp. coracana]
MASPRGGFAVPSGTRSGPWSEDRDLEVKELLRNLHITTEEMEIVKLSDDDEDDDIGNVEVTVIGKELGGDPCLYDSRCDETSMVQQPAVQLGGLKPSDIHFDKMEMWIRVLNLPLGCMNEKRGAKAVSLIGELVKLDVDKDGKASGAFLRARVSVELSKPLQRGEERSYPDVMKASIIWQIREYVATVESEALGEKYLGLLSAIGTSEGGVFDYLPNRICGFVHGWGENTLSCAGREVLLKANTQPAATWDEDVWAWAFERSAFYSMCSANQMLKNDQEQWWLAKESELDTSENDHWWKVLWKMKIPPKALVRFRLATVSKECPTPLLQELGARHSGTTCCQDVGRYDMFEHCS